MNRFTPIIEEKKKIGQIKRVQYIYIPQGRNVTKSVFKRLKVNDVYIECPERTLYVQ